MDQHELAAWRSLWTTGCHYGQRRAMVAMDQPTEATKGDGHYGPEDPQREDRVETRETARYLYPAPGPGGGTRHGTPPHDASEGRRGRPARGRPAERGRPRNGKPAAGPLPALADLCQAITSLFRPHKSWRLHSPRTAPWEGGGGPPPITEGADPTHLPRSTRPHRGRAGRRRSGPWGSTTHCNGSRGPRPALPPTDHACRDAPTCVPCRHNPQDALTKRLRRRHRRWTIQPSGPRPPTVARAGKR